MIDLSVIDFNVLIAAYRQYCKAVKSANGFGPNWAAYIKEQFNIEPHTWNEKIWPVIEDLMGEAELKKLWSEIGNS